MSKGDVSQKDKAMAAHMKEHGPRAPSHWNGVGREDVVLANKMGTEWRGKYTATYERGMLGGYLARALGLGDFEGA